MRRIPHTSLKLFQSLILVVGDPGRARFDVFHFDDTGRAEFEQALVAIRR